MHVHVPKPLHGWKAFFNEIFVIVIGVLIALGLEAVVEALHWRHKVHEAEERLREENAANFFYAAEQVVTAPCVLGQLDGLRERIMASGAVMKPAPLLVAQGDPAVVALIGRPWSMAAWQALNADGTASHMDKSVQQQLGSMYVQIEGRSTERLLMQAMRGRLRVLSLPIPLDASSRLSLLQTIEEAATRVRNSGRVSAEIMRSLRKLDLAPPDAVTQQRFDTGANVKVLVEGCRAMGLPLADWKAVLGNPAGRN